MWGLGRGPRCPLRGRGPRGAWRDSDEALLYDRNVYLSARRNFGERRGQYGWMVSSSSTDPCVNSGAFPPSGLIELHVWYAYNTTLGLGGAALTASTNPPGAVNLLAFNAANGFINAGTTTELLLAVGECPNAPLRAGTWICVPTVANWELCLGSGENVSVNCDPVPIAFPTGREVSRTTSPSPARRRFWTRSFVRRRHLLRPHRLLLRRTSTVGW